MKKKLKTMTPDGTTDLLFAQCNARREVERRLRGIFSGRDYHEVVTPTLEFYDVFASGTQQVAGEQMYKLTDNKGRLLVLRPDSTIPIARLVGTKLKDSTKPVRLFYCQNVFNVTDAERGKQTESCQMGLELLGISSKSADIEVIYTALRAVRELGISDYRLEIGHSGLFRRAAAQLCVTDDKKEEIRELIESKNYPALYRCLEDVPAVPEREMLRKLPSLFGGEEVLEEAAKEQWDDETAAVIGYLTSLYDELKGLPDADKISFDLGLVNDQNYYSGVIFRVYAKGYGEAVMSGGRYDKLVSEFSADIPAIGFGVDVDAVAKNMLAASTDGYEKRADCIVFAEKGRRAAGLTLQEKLISEGKRVEYCLLESREKLEDYAREKGIGEVYIV